MRLEEEEKWLDQTTENVENQLSEMAKDPLYEQFAYVTYEDIKKLNQTKESSDCTLLAIRAPKGTTLEIPDPNSLHDHETTTDVKEESREQFQNQIFLTSPKEEILVYMINDDQKDIKEEDSDTSENNNEDDDELM
jgi:vacuolar-type H+-ATPase subunit E/Vma4